MNFFDNDLEFFMVNILRLSNHWTVLNAIFDPITQFIPDRNVPLWFVAVVPVPDVNRAKGSQEKHMENRKRWRGEGDMSTDREE